MIKSAEDNSTKKMAQKHPVCKHTLIKKINIKRLTKETKQQQQNKLEKSNTPH